MKKQFARITHGPPQETLMIHTGLSVTICGCLLSIERNEQRKVAEVKIDLPRDRSPLTDVETSAINAAASLLAARARRFYGINWRIIELRLDASPRRTGGAVA